MHSMDNLTIDLDPLMVRQCELEADMRCLGTDAFRARIERARERGEESTTPYGLTMMRKGIEPLANAIRQFIGDARTGKAGRRHTAVRYLEQVDPDVAAFITLRVALDSLSSRRVKLLSQAHAIGSRIEDEVRFNAFAEAHKGHYERTLKFIDKSRHYGYRSAVLNYAATVHGVPDPAWPKPDLIHIGTALLHMLAEEVGLISIETRFTKRNRSEVFVAPTEMTMEWVNKRILTIGTMSPMLMPMLVPPREWTSPVEGGYLMNEFPRLSLVKDRLGLTRRHVSARWDTMPDVRGAVSAVSRTGWRIHRRVLETAEEIWERGFEIGKLPPRIEPERPSCPICGGEAGDKVERHPCFADNEPLLKDWKRLAARHYDRVNALRSKRIQAAKILSLAARFKDEEAIYFPHQLDFRGRLYPVPLFLQPQGNDLAKSLLTFAKGKPINDHKALGWLMIHGANVWGYDKVSLEDRIDWVRENEDLILTQALDPLAHMWWTEADKPWQFLAFCFEYADFQRVGWGFVSSLPVSVDGACNGLQHFSAMLRDPVGGAAVNLVPLEKPADIYQEVADIVADKLRLEVSTRGTDAEMAQQWLDFGITRKLTKRPVMVVPYSGTQYTCREYVHEHLRESGKVLPWEPSKEFTATVYITKLIWETIHEVVSSAKHAMDWLRQAARVTAKEGKTLFWVTPTGFPVEQGYPKVTGKMVNMKVGEGVRYQPSIQVTQPGTIDINDQLNGVSPNFVHSLDAAALQRSIRWALENGIEEFAMVHDSYGCPAADAETFGACLREAFVEMYQENDVLAQFKATVEEHAGVQLEEPPAKGDLDLDQVKDSDFFFA